VGGLIKSPQGIRTWCEKGSIYKSPSLARKKKGKKKKKKKNEGTVKFLTARRF